MIGQARTWNEKQLALLYKNTKGTELGSESDVKMLHWKTSFLNWNLFFCFASKRRRFESFMEQLASGSGCALGLHENTYKYMGVFPFRLPVVTNLSSSPRTPVYKFCLCQRSLLIWRPSRKSWSIFWRHQIAACLRLPDLCKPFLCIETIIREVYLLPAHQKHMEFTVLSILNIKVAKKSWKSDKMKTGEIQSEFKTWPKEKQHKEEELIVLYEFRK